MAQTPLSQHLAGSLPEELGGVVPARSWLPAAYGWLHANLLPAATPHDAQPARGPRPVAVARHPLHRLAQLIPNLLIVLVMVLLGGAIALMGFRAMYSDRIYPAVVVGDVNVGGLTTREAEALLTERAADLEQGTIAFTYNGVTWTPTLAEIGARVDLESSIDTAEQLGRGGNAASRLVFTREILRANQVVPLQTRVDMGVLNSWFDRVDAQINNPAVDAQIVVDGANVSISPASTGIVVERKRATEHILSALSTLQPSQSELPVMVGQPDITETDLAPILADAQRAISQPIQIGFEDQAWRIDGATLSGYLTIETVMEHGTPKTVLSVDTERLARELRTNFAPEVNREPKDARVGWNDRQNRIVALEPSETGVTMKASAFAEAVAASYLGDHRMVTIPVVVVLPRIDDHNLEALGITELLGSGDSSFAYGVAGRDENVRLAAEYMDGTLVAPGENFSYNDAIGEITAERGFQEALVVQGEGVGRDVGGGVCQVSTTVFRAALYAGMPITEWYQHTFRLPNYEYDGWSPGFDASILQIGSNPEEWADFQFENYTDNWLYVESHIDYPHVYVNIYGTGDGRTVEFGTYELGTNAFGFHRVISDARGNVIADRSFDSYFL